MMKIPGKYYLIILLILTGINVFDAYPQTSGTKPTRQSALDAFANEDYDQAAKQFTALSGSFPKDPLYKYYTGVCLVKLNRDPARAESLLKEAVLSSAAIRSVPADGLYYLGKAQQAGGNFENAVKSFNRYTDQVGKKMAKEMDVPALIKQCNEKKGQVIPAVGTINEEKKPDTVINKRPEPVRVPVSEIQKKNEITETHSEKVPQSYDQLLLQALRYQHLSDSLTRLAATYREDMLKSDNSARAVLKQKIQDLEEAAASNQRMADRKMADARKLIGKPGEIISDTTPAKPVVKDNLLKADSLRKEISGKIIVSSKDTLSAIKGNPAEIKKVLPDENKTTKDSLTQPKQFAKPPAVEINVKPVFSAFEIKDKPLFKPDDKIELNPEVPAGLIYRLQMAVFRNPVAPSFFKGLSPVYGFRNETTGVSVYYAGMFRKASEAAKALARVKNLGFKDAFVVALMDKKVVSSDRAAILEKEWGSKALFNENLLKPGTTRDTIPPTLVFRVEIARSIKPLATEQIDNIKKMSGARGFDIVVNETKQNIYLVGKFLTFKSAEEYSGLMERNGFKEAKVVAYLGNREIPVETARQLFEEF